MMADQKEHIAASEHCELIFQSAKLCSTSFSLYLPLVISCSAVLWPQLTSNYSLGLVVALPSIICGFFWAKSASLA